MSDDDQHEADDFVAPDRGSADELLDAGAHSDLDAMRHSAAHVMAEALMDLFPGTKLGIGPAIDDGFYYDFDLPRPLTPDDLAAIEERMARQRRRRSPVRPPRGRPRRGRQYFVDRGQPYKVEILDDLAARAKAVGEPLPPVSIYEHGRVHRPVPRARTSRAPAGSARSSCSAWPAPTGAATRRGPCSSGSTGRSGRPRPSSTSTCGGWSEAKKRDHRKLGRELDLFSFHSESPAAPFWHPKGMALWREPWRRGRWRGAPGWRLRRGPDAGGRPQGAVGDLRPLGAVPGQHVRPRGLRTTSGLKPMNCPESMLIYKTQLRSYRDLPMRLADYSWLFRNERTGALAGMFRVRQLTQDDSHVICRDDQVIEEVNLALSLVRRQYAPFGFEPTFKLATRPDEAAGHRRVLGDGRGQARRGARMRLDIAYKLDPGGGAFYAPKIDVFIEDALGREWQMATIQPTTSSRSDSSSSTAAPTAASSGRSSSITRSTAASSASSGSSSSTMPGRFPAWLAPVQAVVIPIADRHVGGRPGAGKRPRLARVARRGRRFGQPDAVQDPAGPGAEGPVHARPR